MSKRNKKEIRNNYLDKFNNNLKDIEVWNKNIDSRRKTVDKETLWKENEDQQELVKECFDFN